MKQALFQGKPKTLDDATEITTKAEAWLGQRRLVDLVWSRPQMTTVRRVPLKFLR